MNGITVNKSYTRSTAEDERDLKNALSGVDVVQPDPDKILPAGEYRIMHGQLRKVVAGVSPMLGSAKK